MQYDSIAAFFDFENEKIFSCLVGDFRQTAFFSGGLPDRSILAYAERRATKPIRTLFSRKSYFSLIALSEDLFSDLLDSCIFITAHFPIACTVANFIKEVRDYIFSVLRVVNFRVKLYTVEPQLLIGDTYIWTFVAVGNKLPIFRYLSHVITVAHPCYALFRHTLKELARCIKICFCAAIFPCGSVLCLCYKTAKVMAQQLTAVANTQNWNTPTENSCIRVR